VYRESAGDLVIATYGNGLWMSLRAAGRLAREHGIEARVLDLRFLVPLPSAEVVRHARETGHLLVVDECRKSAGISEELATAVLESDAAVRFARVTSADSFIPLGDAANLVLASEDEIVAAALRLVSDRPQKRRKRA
jgi:2-oxoisovalerate dehydrogenase E1 component